MKGCERPGNEEEHSKELVKSFIWDSSFGFLFTLGQLSGVFFHT